MSSNTTPLYVVCSPRRCGGKTLISRLLTEFYVLGDRPVAAFDLSDEGPQLGDYLPQFTTIADINDIRGQIAFFERLVAENEGAKIIDLSHRTFKKFFTIVQEIGLFEEAHRHSIEPLILFIIDANPKSSEAYATIRHRFTQASILPVRNMAETIAIAARRTRPSAHATPTSLDVPLLSFSLRALIDRQNFSFSDFWYVKPENLPDSLDDELLDWVECVFCQFWGIELALGCEDNSTQMTIHRQRQPSGTDSRQDAEPGITGAAFDVPAAVLKFAPKQMQRRVAIEQSGNAPVTMMINSGRQLPAPENQLDQLESEIKQWQDRAVLAESRLQLIRKLIEKEIERVRRSECPI